MTPNENSDALRATRALSAWFDKCERAYGRPVDNERVLFANSAAAVTFGDVRAILDALAALTPEGENRG